MNSLQDKKLAAYNEAKAMCEELHNYKGDKRRRYFKQLQANCVDLWLHRMNNFAKELGLPNYIEYFFEGKRVEAKKVEISKEEAKESAVQAEETNQQENNIMNSLELQNDAIYMVYTTNKKRTIFVFDHFANGFIVSKLAIVDGVIVDDFTISANDVVCVRDLNAVELRKFDEMLNRQPKSRIFDGKKLTKGNKKANKAKKQSFVLAKMENNVKFIGYAETEQNGYQPLNDYLIENGNGIEWTDTVCECGQTECIYFQNNKGEQCCIIVCDACYKNNPKDQLY